MKARPKKVLVTGAAGFIGMHCVRRLLARGDKVVGVDNLNDYYSVKLKRDRLKLIAHREFRFHRLDIANERALRAVFDKETARRRAAPRGAGRRALLAREPRRLRAVEPGRLRQPARVLPAAPAAAPGLRLELERLRRQQQAALFRSRQRRPPGEPVRRDQEVQRADGACLQPSLRPAGDRAALLHRLRSVGPARHVADAVRAGDHATASRSRSSTAATCSATSPTSTTSWKARSACSIAPRRTRSTTSATTRRWR